AEDAVDERAQEGGRNGDHDVALRQRRPPRVGADERAEPFLERRDLVAERVELRRPGLPLRLRRLARARREQHGRQQHGDDARPPAPPPLAGFGLRRISTPSPSSPPFTAPTRASNEIHSFPPSASTRSTETSSGTSSAAKRTPPSSTAGTGTARSSVTGTA